MNKIRTISNEVEIREFISSHSGEIKGLYNDVYTKMGGWNGLMYALADVKNRYSIEIEMDELIPIESNDTIEDLFERILREEL